MEQTIQNIINGGLDAKSVFTLLSLMIAFFVLLSIKNFVSQLVAWQMFKANLNISIDNTWLRLPTPTGHVDGRLVQANMKRIVVDIGNAKVHIPTKAFPDRDWVILKKAPGKTENSK